MSSKTRFNIYFEYDDVIEQIDEKSFKIELEQNINAGGNQKFQSLTKINNFDLSINEKGQIESYLCGVMKELGKKNSRSEEIEWTMSSEISNEDLLSILAHAKKDKKFANALVKVAAEHNVDYTLALEEEEEFEF